MKKVLNWMIFAVRKFAMVYMACLIYPFIFVLTFALMLIIPVSVAFAVYFAISHFSNISYFSTANLVMASVFVGIPFFGMVCTMGFEFFEVVDELNTSMMRWAENFLNCINC